MLALAEHPGAAGAINFQKRPFAGRRNQPACGVLAGRFSKAISCARESGEHDGDVKQS